MPENNNDIQHLKQENEQLKTELESYKQREEQSKNIRWWTARKFTGLILGKDLKTSVKTVINEVSEDKKVSKDALSDLISSLITRITRVGAITIFLALLPTFILLVQTGILHQQNKRIDIQNERLKQQTYLQEAERRSSLVFLFSNIMDAIDKELTEDVGEREKRDLSPQLIGRIVALSTRLKPYRYLDGDTLITKPLSPERGQLLISLIQSQLDTNLTLPIIFKNGDFSFSDIKNGNFKSAYLKNINLQYSNLYNATFQNANISKANLANCYSKNTSFALADLRQSNLSDNNLNGANFSKANLIRTKLVNVSLKRAYMKGVICERTEVGKDFFEKIITYQGSDSIIGTHFIQSNYNIYARDVVGNSESGYSIEHFVRYCLGREENNRRMTVKEYQELNQQK